MAGRAEAAGVVIIGRTPSRPDSAQPGLQESPVGCVHGSSGTHRRHHGSLVGNRRGDRPPLRRGGRPPPLRGAGAGAAVALAARRADRIEALAKRIEDEGGRAVALPTDVSDERQARAFIEHAYEHLGRLDILVNNAGLMLLGAVEGADTEQWRQMVHVNILGVLYCTHAALPVMREQGGGHIVNISSVAGRRARLGSAVYNFTKFGVTGFSEALRQEALHAGIRVTVVEPGFVATELQGHNEGNEMVMQTMEKMREQMGEVL